MYKKFQLVIILTLLLSNICPLPNAHSQGVDYTASRTHQSINQVGLDSLIPGQINLNPESLTEDINVIVNGTVSDLRSQPGRGFLVRLLDEDERVVDETVTDDGGRFAFLPYEVTTYQLKLFDSFGEPMKWEGEQLFSVWEQDLQNTEWHQAEHQLRVQKTFNNLELAQRTAGEPTLVQPAAVEVNAQNKAPVEFQATGQLTGVITAEDTGAALADVQVGVFDTTGSYVGQDHTDTDGLYRISGLGAGRYRLHFAPERDGVSAPYISEFYNDKPRLSIADGITVTQGGVSNANAVLSLGASIQGQITDEVTNSPLEDVTIYAYDADGHFVGEAESDSDGNYEIFGLPSGSYRLYFESQDGYVNEYTNDKKYLVQADEVALTLPNSATVNATLQPSGSVTGKVTDRSDGTPIPDVRVYAHTFGEDFVSQATTDESGTYTITNLPDEHYVLELDPGGDQSNIYDEYYYSDYVVIDGPNQVSGIDVALLPKAAKPTIARITGKVTASDTDLPLEDVRVELFDTVTGDFATSTRTDASGFYTTALVTEGTYHVLFEPFSNDYLEKYYDNAPKLAEATPVVIHSTGSVSGIDAALDPGAQITGIVTAEDTDAPLAEVRVYLRTADGDFIDTEETDDSGAYTLRGIPSGTYTLSFEEPFDDSVLASRYLAEYYNNQQTEDDAEVITITAPEILSDINAKLTLGGEISGKLTGADNSQGLSGVDVRVQHMSPLDPFAVFGTTDEDGGYTISGLPAGSYEIEFTTQGSVSDAYLSEVYNDRLADTPGDLVTVALATTTSGIDATLERGGQISGYVSGIARGDVTAAGKRPLEDVSVEIRDKNGDWMGSAQTDAEGYFRTHGLPNGIYWLIFGTDDLNTKDVYIGQDNMEAPITIDGPTIVDIGDTSLTQGLRVMGHIADQTSGQPIDRVDIDISRCDVFDSSSTNSHGLYQMDIGLSSGAYSFRVGSSFSPSTSAKPYIRLNEEGVPLAGTDRVLVDRTMQIGGQISGVVTAADSGEPIRAGIDIYDESGNQVGRVSGSSGTGEYVTMGLPNGTYRLLAEPSSSSDNYLSSEATATISGVTIVENVNISLQPSTVDNNGIISGTITSAENGEPLVDIFVDAIDSTGGSVRNGFDSTNVNGQYYISGLRDGAYKLRFSPTIDGPNREYALQYYESSNTFSTGTAINVTSIESVVVNAALQKGYVITGKLTEQTTGNPIYDAQITVYNSDDEALAASYSDIFGSYRTAPLLPGDYRLRFRTFQYDADCQFYTVTEYHGDTSELETSEVLSINGQSDIENVDAALAIDIPDAPSTPTPTVSATPTPVTPTATPGPGTPTAVVTPVSTPIPGSQDNLFLPFVQQ